MGAMAIVLRILIMVVQLAKSVNTGEKYLINTFVICNICQDIFYVIILFILYSVYTKNISVLLRCFIHFMQNAVMK